MTRASEGKIDIYRGTKRKRTAGKYWNQSLVDKKEIGSVALSALSFCQ
jgi:hypothetical protein